MLQKDLAKLVGYSAKHISDVKIGNEPMTLKLATKLMNATGIPDTDWLWPDRAGYNPWDKVLNN